MLRQKSAKTIQLERIVFSRNRVGTPDTNFLAHAESNSEWTIDTKVKPKSIELIENIGEKSLQTLTRQRFLRTQKTQTVKEKMGKLDFMN